VACAEAVARKCVALRIKGETYRKIAAVLGLSVSSAYEGYRRGLSELCPVEDIAEKRQRARAIIDELRAKIWRWLQEPGCELASFDVAFADRNQSRCVTRTRLRNLFRFDRTIASAERRLDDGADTKKLDRRPTAATGCVASACARRPSRRLWRRRR
jgi:hypothetical protein